MREFLKKPAGNSIGLIGHMIINYPSPQICRDAIKVMVAAGVDLIELQIPFSEPVADGPLFMQANHEALAAGVTVDQCFAFMQEMTQEYKIPFIFTTYANIVYKKGFENFIQQAIKVGAKGAIVPDLSMDKEYLQAAKKHHFATVQLIPPNVTEPRLVKLAKAAHGFIYAVARLGVTGKQTEFGKELSGFLERIRQHSDLPIAVGFGITSPSDVEFLKAKADYAIIGSQTLRVLNEKGLPGLQQFWRSLKQAASN